MGSGKALRLSARPSDPVTRLLRPVPVPRVPSGRSPWLAPFPPPPPRLRLLSPLLGSMASSVIRLHPTPHRRACRTCGFRLLRPDCRWRAQSVIRSPGSRACNFAACLGSQTRWVRRPARDLAPRQRVAFPFRRQGRRPQFVVFEAQYPARRCPYLRFGPHLAVRSARLRVRMDSLLLSCWTLSFLIACRFIPALRPPHAARWRRPSSFVACVASERVARARDADARQQIMRVRAHLLLDAALPAGEKPRC